MSLDAFKTPYKRQRPAPRPNRSGDVPQPWTAARCQRLLRPLLSRIASLRKDTALGLLNPVGDEFKQETSASASSTEQKGTNCEWLGPRKRIRLTYSQKRSSRDQENRSVSGTNHGESRTAKGPRLSKSQALVPGEIVAATPLLRRARGYAVQSPTVSINQVEEPEEPKTKCRRVPRLKREPAEHKALDQRLSRFRAQSASSRYNDLEAIYRSLDALLKATRHNTNQARGPRSFLGMCLRKVPQYIEELEAWERMEAEQNGTISTLDDVDTSAQIYNYLESIGPNQALGWRHLRVVVRADGLNVVRQGILEGLFGDDFSELLVDLCVQNGALSEAEELITAVIGRQYPQPTTPDGSFAELPSLRPLSMLWAFTTKFSRTSFLLRQYSLLLSNNNLPQDWLATREFERVWGLAARCLLTVEAADDAVAFMNHSISLLCRRKRTLAGGPDIARQEKDIAMANRRTLTSALTMLAAMSWLGEIELHSAHVSETEITKIGLIGNRLRYVLTSCVADLGSLRPTQCRFGNDLVHMALFLSSSSTLGDSDISCRLRSSIEQAWRQNMDSGSTRNQPKRHRLDEIASFISSMARSCGRGMSLASHNCLDMLFKQLERLELDREILDSMKAVAAFSLAQQTNNVNDFIYAERLAVGDGTRSRALFTGYRWEETIGEWVTVSPVAKKRRPETTTRQLRPLPMPDVDHSEDCAEQITTQCRGATSGDTHSVPDLEIEQEKGDRRPLTSLALENGFVNAKKRAHPCSGDDKSRSGKDVAPQPTKRKISTYSSLDDELGSDKENRSHAISKKPRRSVDRKSILGAKPRSSLASRRSNSMFGDDSSADELCM
ncbi:hypothetical protein F4677DRAFT_425684 [Hypoxylon crocopeplum]|nr:hypothetical protein F4677DRAFT_425684 [Hypoxylon crocopeplum]